MKKKNVLIFGSNHIENNIQEDIIASLDYNYIGYISDNKSRATKYLVGNYAEMEKIINYIKLSKLEILKVIFPTKEQVRNAFITVFIVVSVVSLFLALVDAIMSFSLSKFI